MSNYEAERPWSMNEYKKAIIAMKNELGGGIMKHFVNLQPKRTPTMKTNMMTIKKQKVRMQKNILLNTKQNLMMIKTAPKQLRLKKQLKF